MSEGDNGGQYYNYQYEQYEHTFRVLLMKFFRDVNLPFSTVDNPLFHDIIRHLNPSVVPPDMKSLVEMGFDNYQQIVSQERHEFHEKLREKVDKEDGNLQYFGQPEIVPHKVFAQLEPVQMTSYQHSNYQPIPYQSVPSFPLNLSRLPNEEDYEQIGHYEYKSGASMWPCLVCLKRPAWATMRKLTQNEATVFLFVCVAEGVYPIEVAKKLCALKTVVCCVNHLTPVYNASLRRLGITNPDQINSAEASLVSYANSLINEIRGVKCEETLRTKMEVRLNGSGPFRHTLRCFFRNYQRKTVGGYMKNGTPPPTHPTPKQKVADPCVPNTTYLPPGTLQRPGDDLEFPEDFLETL